MLYSCTAGHAGMRRPPGRIWEPFFFLAGPSFLLSSVTRLFSHHFLALIVHLRGARVSTVGARRDVFFFFFFFAGKVCSLTCARTLKSRKGHIPCLRLLTLHSVIMTNFCRDSATLQCNSKVIKFTFQSTLFQHLGCWESWFKCHYTGWTRTAIVQSAGTDKYSVVQKYKHNKPNWKRYLY